MDISIAKLEKYRRLSISDHSLDFLEDNVDGESGENTDDGGSHEWRIGENVVDRDGHGLQSSDDRILLREHFSPSFTSPLMMKSFRRLTSDNLTGFNKKSSAPSSKHLQISENKTIKKQDRIYWPPNSIES